MMMAKAAILFEPSTSRPTSWLASLDKQTTGKGEFQADLRFVAGVANAAPAPLDDEATRLAEAFAKGREQGRKDAGEQADTAAGERRKLGSAIRALDTELTEQLAQLLSESVLALCEATLAPAALDTDLLQRRCAKVAAMLEDARSHIVLRLAPADIEQLDDTFRAEWTITPDEALAPGDVRVEGKQGAVADGPSEWSATIAEALATC